MNKLRVTTDKVSKNKRGITKTTRYCDVTYNGSVEEYEDIADYFAQPVMLKGVRIA